MHLPNKSLQPESAFLAPPSNLLLSYRPKIPSFLLISLDRAQLHPSQSSFRKVPEIARIRLLRMYPPHPRIPSIPWLHDRRQLLPHCRTAPNPARMAMLLPLKHRIPRHRRMISSHIKMVCLRLPKQLFLLPPYRPVSLRLHLSREHLPLVS